MRSEIRTEKVKRVAMPVLDLLKELEIDPELYRINRVSLAGYTNGPDTIEMELVERSHEARK